MGWEDRRYREPTERPWRRALRRIFVDGDHFFEWAFHVYTAWGIAVKVHLLFILMILTFGIWGLVSGGPLQAGAVLLGGTFLFGLVLLHEYGHCFACRHVGGEADQILMWPLGGLARCYPPQRWKAAFVTTVGGPAVNLAIFPITGAFLLLFGAPAVGVVLFNPFDPGGATSGAWFQSGSNIEFYFKTALWLLHYMNFLLLLFNVLLPMYPMDGGRMLQELLWAKIGYERSVIMATNIGLVAAIAVGLFALVGQMTILLGIAVFAGITCWQERARINFLRAEGHYIGGGDSGGGFGAEPGSFGASYRDSEDDEDDKPSRSAMKREERERKEQEELDRTLAKISEQGMDSLTRAEKRMLKRATDKRRHGNDG